MKTVRRHQNLLVILLCAALTLLATVQPAQAAPLTQQQPLFPELELSTSKTIKITDAGFDPATISVFGPTDVTWINNTNTTHILRSGDAPAVPAGKIYLPLIQRGSPAAIEAASVYLDYLNQEVQANSFTATLAPSESFTYRFSTPGKVSFYLESAPAIKGEVNLSGVGLLRASPSNGEGDVAVTRETILEFSGSLDPATATAAAFVARAGSTTLDYRLNLSADKSRVTLFYKDPLPGSTRVRVSVDGSKLKDAQGNAVDIDGDGVAGGNSTIEFDTLSLTVVHGTKVCGRVFASELAVNASNVSVNTPLQNVTVSVDGTALQSKTDASGNFCLDPAPVGRFFVHVDGHSATNSVPGGQYYPVVGKAWRSTLGKETNIGDVYLPLIPVGTLQAVSATSDTQITFVDSVLQQNPDLKGVSIKVPANSLFNDDGERGGKVGIAPVPPDRLPGKLPEGLNFPVVITVQTDGAMNFDRPAPVCFPNLPDPITKQKLAAGEKSALWSFDHDTGEWAIVGPMTVSTDGLMVCSDAGVGIRAPGWHGSFPGTPVVGGPSCDTNLPSNPQVSVLQDVSSSESVSQCTCENSPSVEEATTNLVVEGNWGDIIKIDIPSYQALTNFRVTKGDVTRIARRIEGNIDDWEQVLQQRGEIYYVPKIDPDPNKILRGAYLDELTLEADSNKFDCNGQSISGKPVAITIQVRMKDDYSWFTISGPVGPSGQNKGLDIYKVQQRLYYLGFPSRAGNELIVHGLFYPGMEESIRLFQAATYPDQLSDGGNDGNPLDTSNGKVDFGDAKYKTLTWLNSVNAPKWIELVDGKLGGNFDIYRCQTASTVNPCIEQRERFGTSWVVDTVYNATAATSQTDIITALSEDGYTVAHAEHKSGMDIDVNIDGDGRLVGTTTELTAGEQKVVNDMVAFYENAQVSVANLWVGYKRIVDAFNERTGTSKAKFDSGNVHDSHFHVDLIPPEPTELVHLSAANPNTAALNQQDEQNRNVLSAESNLYYRFDSLNGTSVLGYTSESGKLNTILAASTYYTFTVYRPSTQYHDMYGIATNFSGATTDMRTIILNQAGGSDLDTDSLPDIGEHAIGTNPNNPDTDSDGIPDGTEIQNGTDPLDGLPAQTGILGTVDTPGTALDVCVQNDLAVVADGAMGVSVFNVFDSRNPTLVAQVDTPGTAQRVACGEGKAAVVDNDKGLAIIDMRSVVTASVVFQLDLGSPTTAVAVAGNVAYAGTQNGRLVAVDLASGAILQETSLAVRINDLAISGDLLYALTDNNTLHTLDPRFELQLLNSVGTPSTMGNSQRLFAGSDLLYTTHGRGYDTFSLSVPTQPTLIAGGSTNQFGWRQIVSNGSKAGLAITGVNSNTPRNLSLYDISDPSKNDQFQTQFTMPGDATSVALYKGLAYVADGASGLQIVNYLSYDTLGMAPTISVTTTFNGNKAEENSLARVTALVNDDVQVRQVEFYIDGQLVAIDGTYPFEYRFVTPRMSAQTSFKLRVRAVDTGGNAGWSTEQTLTLVPDATAPRILSYIPGITSNAANSVKRVSVTFNEAIKQSTLTVQSFKLLSSGADNLLGTNDDITVAGGTLAYDANNKTASLTFANPLPSGVYRIAVATAVTDLAGNPLASVFMRDFGVGAMIPIGEIVKGTISTQGEQDIYNFTVAPGQEVYFDDQGSSSNYNFFWHLYDPNGKELFNRYLIDNDAGALVLSLGGQYQIQVNASANITGTYQFQLRSVPPDSFNINIGDTVSAGKPGVGAGNIEQPGHKDVYTFQATEGQEVYFDDRGSSSNYNIYWQLYDPNGKQVFSRWLLDNDAGALTLNAGSYKIVVGANANIAGTYQFQIRSVPPDQFTIKIGDTVSNGVPGSGAGNIEQPGNKDVYTFQASQEQEVYFDDRGSSSNYNIYWQLYDPSGKQVFSRWLIDNDAGALVLNAGTYKIVVGANANVAGSYQFQIRSTPPEQFAIKIGDTVANGIPGTGAGNIEQPGNKDIYTFQVAKSQEVYFDDRGSSSNYNIYWQLYDPSGKQVFSRWLIDSDAGALVLDAGTYKVVVGANANVAGSYQFQIRSIPPDQFTVNIGDTVSNGFPRTGAGNIEQPGNKDIYTFQATQGQEVYFDDRGSSSNYNIYWQLYDASNKQIFSRWLIDSDAGALLLNSGTYTIVVGANANVAGTYQFQIRSVPPDQFTLNIGDTVSNGTPGAGAGNIEQPGNKDIYTFQANGGRSVYFDDQGASSNSNIYWRLYDPKGTQLFSYWLNSNDPGARTLALTGTYTIVVAASANIAGTYQFQIRDATALEAANAATAADSEDLVAAEIARRREEEEATPNEQRIYLPLVNR